MHVHFSRGRRRLMFALAFVQAIVIHGVRAQHPEPLVPGSENVVLGAFALRHPDVLAELKLESSGFQKLHADLESQVRGAGEPDLQRGPDRRPLTAEQVQALNWLLLDSLSPREGTRLIQLLNRQAAVLAQSPRDARIIHLPIPIFAHPLQDRLKLAPQTGESLDQLFESSHAAVQKRLGLYRAAVNEERMNFLANARAKLAGEAGEKLAALVGTSIDSRLWPRDTRASQASDIWRRLQLGRGPLFPELWFEGPESAMAVGPALNAAIRLLADNEQIAERELALTTAQMELISRAAEIGRAPLPAGTDWQRNPVDQLQFLMSESQARSRQQSFVRDEFIGSLQPDQLTRFRQLVNQAVLGDLPVTWLAFDTRVQRQLAIDADFIRSLNEAQAALDKGIDKIKSEFRDEVWRIYRTAEREALAALTVAQREQYHDWFGGLFAFENPTWRTLLSLEDILVEASNR